VRDGLPRRYFKADRALAGGDLPADQRSPRRIDGTVPPVKVKSRPLPRFRRFSLEKNTATCHVQACRNKGLILQAVSGRVKDDLGALYLFRLSA
jgi:hypothetical protein